MTLVAEVNTIMADDVLPRLRVFLGEQSLALNDRLPPERALSCQLGVTRTSLRKALAVLESEGQVWRHVGRGTFIGARPLLNLEEVQYLGSISSPFQIIDARLAMEPELAALAALRAVEADLSELRLCHRRCREAKLWRVFEAWDNRFHYAISVATKNKLLMTLFETLNAVRRTVAWQTIRTGAGPPRNYSTFAEHDAICEAITNRDPRAASRSMHEHLSSVRTRIVAPQPESGRP